MNEEPNWQNDPLWWFGEAACQGYNPLIFTVPVGGRSALAKSVCNGCVAANTCFWYALANEGDERSGVYGGFTPEERSFYVDLHYGKMPGRQVAVWRHAREEYQLSRDSLWAFLHGLDR